MALRATTQHIYYFWGGKSGIDVINLYSDWGDFTELADANKSVAFVNAKLNTSSPQFRETLPRIIIESETKIVLDMANAADVGDNIDMYITIVEFDNDDVNIQHGIRGNGSGSDTTNYTISAVDLSSSIPYLQMRDVYTDGRTIPAEAELTNTTTLTVRRPPGGPTHYFAWVAIDFGSANIDNLETGTIDLNVGTDSYTTNGLLSSNFDHDKTALFWYNFADNGSTLPNNIHSTGGYIQFQGTSPTDDLYAYLTASHNSDTRLRYWAIEFAGDVSVQHGNQTIGTGDGTSVDTTITSVDLDRSMVWPGNYFPFAKTNNTQEDTSDFISRELTTSTNLQFQRNSTGSYSYDVEWQVIEFDETVYEQEGYRFRADDGSESGASWLADQDTDTSRPIETTTRLRTIVDTTGGGGTNAEGLQLEYRKVGDADSEWRKIE